MKEKSKHTRHCDYGCQLERHSRRAEHIAETSYGHINMLCRFITAYGRVPHYNRVDQFPHCDSNIQDKFSTTENACNVTSRTTCHIKCNEQKS